MIIDLRWRRLSEPQQNALALVGREYAFVPEQHCVSIDALEELISLGLCEEFDGMWFLSQQARPMFGLCESCNGPTPLSRLETLRVPHEHRFHWAPNQQVCPACQEEYGAKCQSRN